MRTGPFIGCLTVALLALAALQGWHACDDTVSRQRRADNAQLVEVLLLTDLALWTEASYTRHPSQANRFSAFQNGPASPDCFPSGTWVRPNAPPTGGGPPAHCRKP